ncbi:MAG: homocysteine S-methyltransferase family protein [Psychromonas sp.]
MSKQTVTILDGGMGRELKKRGAPFRQPEWSALAMIEAPEAVAEVHKAFIENGAKVITANSYALVPFHIGETLFAKEAEQLADRAGKVARQAVTDMHSDAYVAGSLPPLFGSYRADLFNSERAEEIVSPLIKGLSNHVDLWLAETQSNILEATLIKQQVDAITADNKPFWVSFTLEDSEETMQPCLRSGETVVAAIQAMVALNVDAILFNCCQPEIIGDALAVATAELKRLGAADIELGAYANAFPPQPKDATANAGLSIIREDLTPVSYLDWADKWRSKGATIIGGCCGIGPEHIAALSKHFSE